MAESFAKAIPSTRRLALATGAAYPELAESIGEYIGVDVLKPDSERHDDGEMYVNYGESVRGTDLFIVQSHVADVNVSILEHTLLRSAAENASAKRITLVAPFLGYSRQHERNDRESAAAKEIMRILQGSRNHHMMSVDLHLPQTQGFIDVFDNLPARGLFVPGLEDWLADPDEMVVVAPDATRPKMVERFGNRLGTNIAMVNRGLLSRDGRQSIPTDVLGSVDGKNCLLLGDIIDTAHQITSAAEMLEQLGAKGIRVAATHGVFNGDSLQNIKNSPIEEIHVTDTLPQDRAIAALGDRVHVVTVAPLVGDAIKAIFLNQSISEKFQGDFLY